jgi:hypothetical protein
LLAAVLSLSTVSKRGIVDVETSALCNRDIEQF